MLVPSELWSAKQGLSVAHGEARKTNPKQKRTVEDIPSSATSSIGRWEDQTKTAHACHGSSAPRAREHPRVLPVPTTPLPWLLVVDMRGTAGAMSVRQGQRGGGGDGAATQSSTLGETGGGAPRGAGDEAGRLYRRRHRHASCAARRGWCCGLALGHSQRHSRLVLCP